MPQSGFAPNFPGPVAGQTFQSTLFTPVSGTYTEQNMRVIPQRITLMTNGTTEVNVFGTTNGISGTFIGAARIISKDDANGNITLQHTSAGTVLFTIAKGSQGSVKGSYFAATAFAATGTATIKSSGTGNAVVEIDFIASNPALPGAQ